jgi:hypothetical protein
MMTMTARDFLTEMNGILDKLIDDTQDLAVPVAAHKLADQLALEDPALLDGWLHACAEAFLHNALLQRNRQRRSAYRGPRAQFSRDAKEGAFTAYRLRFQISDGSQRSLAKLTAEDCLFVAAGYRSRADQLSSRAAFFEGLAEKVPVGSTVADVLTEDEVSAAWENS